MMALSTKMISPREQVKEGLERTGATVKMVRPAGKIVLPLLVYAEVSNVKLDRWHDRLEYQVDVYAGSFEACVDLVAAVDDIMTPMGWTRTYTSPDSTAREDDELYHKALSYTAGVDLIHGRFIDS